MASSFIDNLLGSVVDEKAVSAVVGSLESQLASPSGTTSSSVATVKTLPLLQRSSQVPSASSSSAASNASQSNNSVVATLTNNTASSQAITGKTSYHPNTSTGVVSTPINIAPRPIVTSAVSLAPRTVTLLSPRSGTRGYLPVQSTGMGLPSLMMSQVGGQLPHTSRMVPGAMTLPRTATPQNLVSKLSSQVHNVQQTGSAQRVTVNQIKQEPHMNQPHMLNNNLHTRPPATGQVAQNHTNLLVRNKSGPGQGNVVNHVSPSVLTKTVVSTAGVITTASASGTVQSNIKTQAQVNRVKEQVVKLQGFFAKLVDLATLQSPAVGQKVRELIKDVMDSKLTEEDFTSQLEKTLHSPSQPNLVHFLKTTLPFLRMAKQQQVVATPTVHQIQKSVAAVSKSQPTILPSNQVTRQVPAVAAVAKPRVKPAATQQLILNEQTFSQLSPLQQQQILAQYPRLQQVFHTSKIPTSKPVVLISTQTTNRAAAAVSTSKPVPSSTAQAQDKSKARPTSSISAVTSGNDDDINDVACMAGVNLQEEQSKILATNSEILNLQLRSCKDSYFLNNKLLQKQIEEIASKHGVSSVSSSICGLVSHATQERLMNIMEKLSIFSLHRLETMKDDPTYQPTSDVKSQLRVFEQIDEIERRKREAREREVLIRAAKSRSRQEDPEQARLKEKAKQLQLEEEETLRKRAANKTALDAIGPRKKRKLEDVLSNGAEGSPTAAANQSTAATNSIRNQFPRQRTRRVILKDLLLIMEQEKEQCHSKLLYKALMK